MDALYTWFVWHPGQLDPPFPRVARTPELAAVQTAEALGAAPTDAIGVITRIPFNTLVDIDEPGEVVAVGPTEAFRLM